MGKSQSPGDERKELSSTHRSTFKSHKWKEHFPLENDQAAAEPLTIESRAQFKKKKRLEECTAEYNPTGWSYLYEQGCPQEYPRQERGNKEHSRMPALLKYQHRNQSHNSSQI